MKLAGIRSNFLNKTTGLLVTAGFVAWSATHVAGMIWHVLAPDTELSASGVNTTQGFLLAQQTVSAQTVDLARLQSVFVLSPMGRSSGSSEAVDASVQATETRLALSLKGAVSSSDPARSRAIIASADTQEVYQAGESLRNTPGNVVLQEIHQNYVLLDNNGHIETLRMDDPKPSVVLTAASSETITQADNAPTGSLALPVGIDRNTVLTDLVRIQPVFEPTDSPRAGALRGLQIRHGSRNDFLAAVGLQQGDLITAVDGQPLHAASDLPALISQLSSQQAVSLHVLRDQTALTVELDRSRW